MTRTTLAKVPTEVAAMFDEIAHKYDRTNDVLTLWQSRVWRAGLRAAVAPQPGEKILDLAAGTGTSAVALARNSGAEVVACDLSEGMIAYGRAKHPEIEFVRANALDLPFADNTFDCVTISFGLRNMPDPQRVLAEMYRVTKPGGRLVVCEFSHPPYLPLRTLYTWFLVQVMPRVAKLSAGVRDAYEYLSESILAWPNQEELGKQIQAAGWQAVEFRNISVGIVALHRGRK